MISDIVPNPFIGYEIVEKLLRILLNDLKFEKNQLGDFTSLIIEELRRGLISERSKMAEKLFKNRVSSGQFQFRLKQDNSNWRMPFFIETKEPEDGRQLLGNLGGALERSLFSPVYESEFNQDERKVAIYLDSESTLNWWHRNVARTQYGIQGWERSRIYPDFIFSVKKLETKNQITILETKGDHLDNLDTGYKKNLLNFLTKVFTWDDITPAGQFEGILKDGYSIQCALVLYSEWKSKLPKIITK